MGLSEQQRKTFVAMLPVVGRIARDIMRGSRLALDYEDLFQDGCLGLIAALERYDPAQGAAWPRYAALRIRGAMLDGLRARFFSWRAARRRPRSCRQCPESEALAGVLRCTVRNVEVSLGLLGLPDWCPRKLPYSEISIDALTTTPRHFVVQPLDRDWLLSERLRRQIAHLPDREKRIVVDYYVHGRPFSAIARALGITEAHVSRLHARILARLRRRLRLAGRRGRQEGREAG